MKLSNSPIVKLWPYLLAFAFWALVIDLSFDSCENSSLKKENEQLRYDLAHAQIHVPPERFYIHDTVEVVKQQVQVVERLKPVLTDEDRALLKDLKLKLNNVGRCSIRASKTMGASPSTILTRSWNQGTAI